ncbi:kinase [Phenylobacterium sp. 20VBR1]|uniref:Kinase n=1 Tax=Phenylobacterium glaciei TaxID=2803784 RepID=A0A941CYA4_9CAUL|nr:kinase [Phenylobacterium glaciei]MBR7618860.1 kinase [Phenylobacterium glaciei]
MGAGVDPWLTDFIAAEGLPPDFAETALAICSPLAERILSQVGEPGLVVGICGAQASGKSTLTAVLRAMLEDHGLVVAALSLDDLYLTHAERQALAREIHPLLATRGVPGTHDVELGLAVLDGLARSDETRLPAFDKAADDRRPDGVPASGPVDVILFEGWCVGAVPQADVAAPINALERERDADGRWRTFVNAALAGPYQALFARIGLLVLLKAPSFEVVLAWRQEQEAKLRARLAREGGNLKRAMTDDQVADFIAHYERLTRHILAEMPGRADVLVTLDDARRPRA